MKARVYFNLHKKLWSVQIKNAKGVWYVAFHAQTVQLEDVRWTVSEAGRQRVIREGRKNVHAYCMGTLVGMWGATVARDIRNIALWRDLAAVHQIDPGKWSRVHYNPYETATFEAYGKPLHESGAAFLGTEGNKALVFACNFLSM
jgi:hypothetical protein